MPRTIVHSCSSSLVRPNGIVRYINSVIDLQKSWGHRVIFVSDAKPTESISADEIVYTNEESSYSPWNPNKPHVDGDLPDLHIDNNLVAQLRNAFRKLDVEPDLVIVHDLHSYLAADFEDGIFVQHESDVLYPGKRNSYMSDQWVAAQIDVVQNTQWRIGSVIRNPVIQAQRMIYTPPPFTPVDYNSEKTRGLLYIGQSREAKGAPEFMRMSRKLGLRPVVITHDIDDTLFNGAEVHSFNLSQRAEMFKLMSTCSAAYIPSKNECFSLAVLECLQFMPTIVDSQYEWTQHVQEVGAILATGAALPAVIDAQLKNMQPHDRRLLEIYSTNSRQYWRNLST
jgi:hypothetical protein